MNERKELTPEMLDKVAAGQYIPARIDMLDPADNKDGWIDAIRQSASDRKRILGTGMDQTISDVQESYRSIGLEIIHLREYIVPIWGTLG